MCSVAPAERKLRGTRLFCVTQGSVRGNIRPNLDLVTVSAMAGQTLQNQCQGHETDRWLPQSKGDQWLRWGAREYSWL